MTGCGAADRLQLKYLHYRVLLESVDSVDQGIIKVYTWNPKPSARKPQPLTLARSLRLRPYTWNLRPCGSPLSLVAADVATVATSVFQIPRCPDSYLASKNSHEAPRLKAGSASSLESGQTPPLIPDPRPRRGWCDPDPRGLLWRQLCS